MGVHLTPLEVRGLITSLFEAVNTCFLQISRKFAAVLLKIRFSEIRDGVKDSGHVVK